MCCATSPVPALTRIPRASGSNRLHERRLLTGPRVLTSDLGGNAHANLHSIRRSSPLRCTLQRPGDRAVGTRCPQQQGCHERPAGRAFPGYRDGCGATGREQRLPERPQSGDSAAAGARQSRACVTSGRNGRRGRSTEGDHESRGRAGSGGRQADIQGHAATHDRGGREGHPHRRRGCRDAIFSSRHQHAAGHEIRAHRGA